MDPADASIRVDSSPEAAVPIPKRFWWLKRSPVFLLLPLLILAAARSCSVYLAEHQLAQEIQSLRDRGEGVDLSAFRQPPVPASEDAAPLLRQAAGLSSTYRASANLTTEQWVGRNGSALALTRRVREFSRAQWDKGLNNPTNPVPRVDLLQLLNLQLLLSRSADVSAHSANPVAVIEYMRDSLHIARLIGRAPDPLSQRMATAWQMAVVRTLDGDSPAMVDRKSAGTTGGDNETLATSTRLLIEELLDPTDLLDFGQFIRGVRAQTIFLMTDPRVEQEGWFYFRKPNRWERFLLFVFRAKIERADLQYLRYLNENAHLALSAPPARPLEAAPTRVEVLDFRLGSGHSDLSSLRFFCEDAVARRRLAATGLAIRLYQRDHHGEYPKTLDELVPEYLPSIPRDPFDPANGPLRMSVDRPLRVFSVGFDGRDISFGLDHPIAPIPPLRYSPGRRPFRPPSTSQTQPASRPDH